MLWAQLGQTFIFSPALPSSTISSGLNALAAIALRDFLPPDRREAMSDQHQVKHSFLFGHNKNCFQSQAMLTKVFSVMFGLLAYGVTFLIRC